MLNKKLLTAGFVAIGAYLYYKNSLTVQYDDYLMGGESGEGGFMQVMGGYVTTLVNGKAVDYVSENYKGLLPFMENGIKKGFRGGKWYPHDDGTGVETIAFGHRIYLSEGSSKLAKYKAGLSTDEAYALMLSDITKTAAGVVKYRNNLTQGQFDALCDFCYNAGGGTFSRKVEPSLKIGRVDLALQATVKHYSDISTGKNANVAAGWAKRSKYQQNMAGRGIYSVVP